MTSYERGDVVLVPFPFADRSVAKKRPAVVVSSGAYHTACNEVIIAQITSRLAGTPRPGDHRVVAWREAGLLAPSLVRAKLATLHSGLLFRRLGAMLPSDMRAIDRGLALALGLGKGAKEERNG
ncbi:MAG: type II toxin-antitoxin system PemK/MazF family toxin [Dehalococcoidia bacterium]